MKSEDSWGILKGNVQGSSSRIITKKAQVKEQNIGAAELTFCEPLSKSYSSVERADSLEEEPFTGAVCSWGFDQNTWG